MEAKKKSPAGSMKISQDVLATIAQVAAMEIEGVAGLAEPESYVKKAFNRSIGRSPIQIELNDDFVKLTLAIKLEYGAKINDVCTAVQNNVKDNIQTMTGMAVAKVNVTVADIVFPEHAMQAEE